MKIGHQSTRKPAPENPSVGGTSEGLPLADLERYIEDWLFHAEFRQQTPRTIEEKKNFSDKLLWFMRHNNYETVGTTEIKRYLSYLGKGHRDPGGRWGNSNCDRPLRPITIKNKFIYIKGLFSWMVQENLIERSPVDGITAPVARPSHISPFTQEHIQALLRAASRGRHAKRDEAMILFLLDTGVRASELCGIKIADIDLHGRRVFVMGKGNKGRTLSFGRNTARAVWNYLKGKGRGDEEPLFISEGGNTAGETLTRCGLAKIITRLGEAAGLQAVRCSPHTFRHTFAIEFLRNGGNVFTLRLMLGHNSLVQTQVYLEFAQADIENQHRMFSPGDRIKRS